MDATIITLERLRELLDYDRKTGVFTWRVARRRSTKAGSIAGTVAPFGYRVIKLDGRSYKAHRLAWLYVKGAWPVGEIDHKGPDKADNRIENLREATHSLNMQNQRVPHADNTSGYLGVEWRKDCHKWTASIRINGVRRHLGYFKSAELAHAAYLAAKRALHEFCTI